MPQVGHDAIIPVYRCLEPVRGYPDQHRCINTHLEIHLLTFSLSSDKNLRGVRSLEGPVSVRWIHGAKFELYLQLKDSRQ
jgi:hypothetical protein